MTTTRYMQATEVALALGVGSSAISNWLKRGVGPLPEPAAMVGKRPLWTPDQIEPLCKQAIEEAQLRLLALERVHEILFGEGVEQ